MTNIKLTASKLREQQYEYWGNFGQEAQINLRLNRAIFKSPTYIDIIFDEELSDELITRLSDLDENTLGYKLKQKAKVTVGSEIMEQFVTIVVSKTEITRPDNPITPYEYRISWDN